MAAAAAVSASAAARRPSCCCTAHRVAGSQCVFPGARARVARRQRTAVLAAATGAGNGEDPLSSSTVPDTLPVASADSDWRTFRAQLVAASVAGKAPPAASAGAEPRAAASPGSSWAHKLAGPEQGCLLLANPLMFQTSQTYFYLSVILLLEHNENGAIGIILNRRTEHKIGSLTKDEAGGLQPEFDDCQLYLGGDVDPSALFLLHDISGLAESKEVFPGAYVGGFQAAQRGLAEGRFTPGQFKILTRYAGWGAGQLEAECKRGVWLPVSASAAAVMDPPAAATRHFEGLWHHFAQLAGGDLERLSQEVLGVAYPEIAQAAAGQYQAEDEEQDAAGTNDTAAPEGPSSGGGGGGGGEPGGGERRQQRRSKLPETDWRDGAGI